MCDKLLGSWKKRPRYRTAWLLETQADPYTIAYPNSYASTYDEPSTQYSSYYPDSTSEQIYYLPPPSCNPTYLKARSCQADYSSPPRKRCNKTRSKSLVGKTEKSEGKDGNKDDEESPKSTKRDELKPNDDPKVETDDQVSSSDSSKLCDACCKRFSPTIGSSSSSADKPRINSRLSDPMTHSSSSCPYYEIAKASHLFCRPLSRTGLQQTLSHSNAKSHQCSLSSRTVCPGYSQTSCPANFRSQNFYCGVQTPCKKYSVTCLAHEDSNNHSSHCPGLSQCPSFKRDFAKPVPNITCFSTNPYNNNNLKSYSFECPGLRKPSQMLSTCLPHDVICPNVCALRTVGMDTKSYKTCPISEQYKKLCSCSQENTAYPYPSEKHTGSCCCIVKQGSIVCRGGSCSSVHNYRELDPSSGSTCPFQNVQQKSDITVQCPAFHTSPSTSKNGCGNLCPHFNQSSSEEHQFGNRCNRISVSFKENEKRDIGIQCPAFVDDPVKAYSFSKQSFDDGNRFSYMKNENKEIAVQCPAFANIPAASEEDALNSCPYFKSTLARKPATESNKFKRSEPKAIAFQCPAFANMPSSSTNDAVNSYSCSREIFGDNSTSGVSCVRFKRNKASENDKKYCSHIRTPSSPESCSTHQCPYYTSKQDRKFGSILNVPNDEFKKNYTQEAFPPKDDQVNLLTCLKHSLEQMSASAQSCSGKPTAPRNAGTKCILGKCEDLPEVQAFRSRISQGNSGQAQSSQVQSNACLHNLCPNIVNFPTTYPPVKPGCKYCEIISNALSIMEQNLQQCENLNQDLCANSSKDVEENNTCELQECPANQNIAEKKSSRDTCTENDNCQRMI